MLAAIFGMLAYCTNPFDTRAPEEPDPGSGQPSIGNSLQNNPDSVLTKIKLAFNQKNPQFYQECFADPYKIGVLFLFTPEQKEAARLVNWMFDDEKAYFSNFVGNEDLVNVELKDSILSSFETSLDTFKTEFIYEITAEFRTKTDRYQGRTWSTLKANYR
jgi:hypothetical protein